MSDRRLAACLALPLWLGLGHTAEGQQDTAYEAAPVVRANEVLPQALLRSGHHRVLPDTDLDGNRLVVEIESDFGLYRVGSLAMVGIRVHELLTLARVVEPDGRGSQRLAGESRGPMQVGSDSVRGDRPLASESQGQLQVGGDSVFGILTSPFSTTSKLLDQTSGKVDQTFEELNQIGQSGSGPPSDVAAAAPPVSPQSDPVLDAYRRSIAGQLGLDVYSTNRRVQTFLDRAAAARVRGQRAAGTAAMSLTRSPEILVAGGQVEAAVRSVMAHNTDDELFRYASQNLRSMAIDAPVVEAFLGHPHLSPRHKIAVTEYLRFLRDVDNRGAVLTAALATATEDEAASFVRLMRMLAAYHERHATLVEFASHSPWPLARTSAGDAVVALPFDVVYWDRETERLFTTVAEQSARSGNRKVDVLTGGLVTPIAIRELQRSGFEVRDRFLFRR